MNSINPVNTLNTPWKETKALINLEGIPNCQKHLPCKEEGKKIILNLMVYPQSSFSLNILHSYSENLSQN